MLLELYRLGEAGKGMIDHLTEVFKRNKFPNAANFVRRQLKAGRLTLLLDGLDELAGERRIEVAREITDFLGEFDQCKAVITCRTAVYGGWLDHAIDQNLEIADFDDPQLHRFLAGWAAEMPPEKSVDQLLNSLRERPTIMRLARNPLHWAREIVRTGDITATPESVLEGLVDGHKWKVAR